MKAILLCLLVTLVTAQTQLLGGKRCTWGPSYWCSHVNNAKACGAVEHCMSTVWKHQIIQPKNTNECMYCQFGFNELKEALENQEVQKEIAKYVSDMCKVLPDPDWKATCDGIVTEDLPIVIEMLDNKIKSEMICAAIGMCSGLEDTYSPYGVLADTDKTDVKSSNSTCADCMKFFQDVQQSIVSNETLNQLEQLFDQLVCNEIKSLTSLCQDAVRSALPPLLQFLADQVDPNIVCRVFGFCVSSKYIDVIPFKNVFKDLKQPLKYRSSEECEACKDIITEVDNTLRDESTQAVIKSDLETYVCNNLAGLAGTCKQLVEEYLPQLFELLVNELDPETFCEAVGICTVPSGSLTIPALKMEPASLISNGYTADSVSCTICKIIMQEVENFLKSNGTITEVEDLIDNICDKLPSSDLKNQCLSFVKEYGQMVVDLLASEISPNATCTFLKLCTAKTPVSVPNMEDVECDLCVIGVKQLQKLLVNVSTDEIVNDLKAVCAFLPANLSITCVKYVQQYAPIAIDLLKSEKDPKALCQLVEVCTTSYGSHHPYMTKPIPEDKVLSPTHKKITDSLQVSVECEVCNTILFTLKTLLRNNATEEEIEAEIEKVCDKFGEFKSVCDSLVKSYLGEMIQYLLDKLEPEEICTKIGLCKPTQTRVLNLKAGILSPVDTLPIVAQEVKKAPVVTIAETKTFKGEVECDACKLVMEAADKALQQKSTQDKIKDLMLDVCKDLPEFHSECANLVNTYYMVAINYLLLSQSPASICKELELCPATENQPQEVNTKLSPALSGNIENGALCVVCEFIMKEVEDQLQANASEAEIEAVLDKVCSILPSTISTECDDFVNEYSALIIKLLVNQVSPSQVCTALKLCSSNKMKGLATAVKILSAKDTAGSFECVICKEVVEQLNEFLKENKTEAEITALLKEFCDELPDTISAQCEDVVNMYVPAIIALIGQDLNPTQVCEKIGLCNATQNSLIMKEQHPAQATAKKTDSTLFFKPHLLGEEKCTYGPAFWCASQENAKLCEAEEHCRRHVWN